jgi:hypothetical protein
MTTIDPEPLTDLDRLIAAVEATGEPEAPVVVIHSGGDTVRFAEVLAHTGTRVVVTEGASDVALIGQIMSARRERETALIALARAALRHFKDESVDELVDLLEKSVEELDESRQRAGEIEGERGPDDPFTISQLLPETYREWFLNDYREALRDAYPPEGFLALQRMLRHWRRRAEWYTEPGHGEELEAARQAVEEGGERPVGHSWQAVRSNLQKQGRLR